MTLGGKIKKRLLERQVERRLEEYGRPYSDREVLETQLALFNGCWRKMAHEIPFYRDLQRRNNIPSTINSWEEFFELFPVARREDIQSNGKEMVNRKRKPDFIRTTSGTTARPVQMPAWNSELMYTRPDRWMARTWYDIQLDDRGFLVWNTQSLEPGMKRLIDLLTTYLYDKAAGDLRISAYDISEEKMRKAARSLLRHKPDYILAYSMSLDTFARVNMHLGREFRSLGLKAVIGAAEGFPSQDSTRLIGELFGCTLAMEYASLEAGLMAHTHPSDGYSVFWRNYFIEACEEGPGGDRILRLTSLYERCFPLVRYELGDEIELCEEGGSYGLRAFKEIRGRINSYVLMRNGTSIHTGVFAQCVRDIEGIAAHQIIRGRDGVTFNLLMKGNLSGTCKELITTRLCRIHPILADVRIEAVETLLRTTAGKTPAIIDDPEASA